MKLTPDGKLWVPEADNYFGIGFEKIICRKVLSLIKPKGTFLDIGGNLGLWSIRFAEHFDKVYTIEPVQEHIQCMKANFELYNINSTILPIGASDSKGTARIRLTPNNCGRASLNFRIKTGLHEIVKLDILDDLIKETDISFIKMDVEGHEVQALNGMTRILQQNNPVIFIEVLKRDKKKPNNALDFLGSIGYEIQQRFGDNFLLTRIK